MEITCPFCRSKIGMDDVNVSTDLVLCRTCGKTSRFSELADDTSSSPPDLNAPPPGTWFERRADGFRTGATMRSWFALFIVPFTCIWSGGSLFGIYGTQLRSGEFSLFQSLFGIPFLLGSLFLVGLSAMMIAGKCSVELCGDRLSVFTGIGWVGLRRTYSWTDFTSVREDVCMSANRGGWKGSSTGKSIVLEGKRRIAFGSMWSENRRHFVLSAIREMMHSSSRSNMFSTATPLFR